MNAPLRHPVIDEAAARDFDMADFAECCEYQLWFIAEGWISKQVAVDNLQFLAASMGLVTNAGQDAVQALLAEAFAPPQTDPCPLVPELPTDYAAQTVMQWELDDARDRWKWTGEPRPSIRSVVTQRAPYAPPPSTVDAFLYLAALDDMPRLKTWLDDHRRDAPKLLEILESKLC